MRICLRFLTAVVIAIACSAAAQADIGVPTDGLDVLELDDGRVLRCVVGEEKDGRVPLTLGSVTIQVDPARLARVRYFRDFDSTPRNDDEQAKVAKGLVRWEGKWLAKEKADALRQAELDAANKIREADEAHALWENRWKIDTKHFHIESNISRAKLDFYAGLLEDFYKQFTKRFDVKLTQREKKKKLPVFIYRLREEYFKRYREDTGGKGEHTGGYFVPVMGKERLVLFDQPHATAEVVDVLLHEATHFILHLAEPQVLLSRWLHEGCAEFFGASTYEKGKFQPGHVQDFRLLTFQRMVKSDQVIPIDDLLRAGVPGEDLNFESRYYAQAWTIVHYVLNTKKYASKFRGYMKKLLSRRGMDYHPIKASARKFVKPEDDKVVLKRALKLRSYEKFMKEVADYAMELPMRGAGAYVYRGEIRYWNEKDPQGAQEDFDMALERGGDDPAVLTQLARAFSQIPGKEGESNKLLERALELDPLDVGIRYRYARRLEPKKAIPQLRLCMAVEPDRGGPLGDLAWLIYLENVKEPYRAKTEKDIAIVEEALALAEKAIDLDPNHRHLDTCAALQLCMGNFEKARDIQVRAVQEEPESVVYLRRLALYQALLGEADAFAKTLRRSDLLLRREAGDAGAGVAAAIQKYVSDAVYRTINACYDWGREKECAKAVSAWYRRRPPKTESEWSMYIRLVERGSGVEDAKAVAQEALEALPDSEALKLLLRSLKRKG